MKRFTKVLTLIFIVACLFTVLAVSGSAAEDLDPIVLVNDNYDSTAVGTAKESNAGGYGYMGIKETDESGDHYVEHKFETGSGHSYLSGMYDYNSKYTADKYSVAAIDFDIMHTGNGYFPIDGSHYIKYVAPGAAFSTRGNTAAATIKFTSFEGALPENAYEWSHVTLVYTYTTDDEYGYLNTYAYVNGELVAKSEKAKKLLLADYPASGLYLTDMRLSNTATSGKGVSAYDNLKATLYPVGTTPDQAATYYYGEDYEFPFTRKACTLNDKLYDSVEKAIKDAKEGDTIKLVADVTAPVSVEKGIYIDTNVYEGGVVTGEYYDITYSSTTLVPSKENGIIFFSFLQNASVEIYWDDCPFLVNGEECACDPEFLAPDGTHAMLCMTESAMLNTVPSYPGVIPQFPVINARQYEFVGWSYTKGGQAEELRPITQEDCNLGYIILYPVYNVTTYDVEAISADGTTSKFYKAEDFTSAISTVEAGGTIKLYNDIVISDSIKFAKNLTIDLNGYDLFLYAKATATYAATYNAETGTYTKGKAIKDYSSPYLFYFGSSGFTFNLTSSKPGSVVSGVLDLEQQLIYEDEVVDTIYTNVGAGLINCYPSDSTFNIYGENIIFYVSTLVYGEHGGNGSNLSFNIDGGTYVYTGSYEGLLALRRGGNHTIKNATFFCNGNNIVRGGAYDKSTKVTFENCDIVNATVSISSASDVFTFNNCRLDFTGIAYGKGTIAYGQNTVYTVENSNVILGEDLSKAAYATNETYSYPEFVYTSENYTYKIKAYSRDAAFSYKVINPELDSTTVYWVGLDGEIVETSIAIKNSTIAAPTVKIPVGDGYRAITNPKWVDADGNAANFNIGSESAYTFYATLPDEAAEYVSCVDGALFSLVYYAHFGYNVYLPVVDGVEVTNIGGRTGSSIGKVYVDGVEYYVATTVYPDSTGALNNQDIKCYYTIDGVNYEVTFKVSAIMYANMIVDDPASKDFEKEAVGCMVRYIEESYKASGRYTDWAKGEIEAFYAKYTPAPYVTEYPDALTPDYAAVNEHIDSIHWTLQGNRVALVITLTDEAVKNGYKVFTSGIAYGLLTTTDGGKTWYTNNTKLATSVMAKYYISIVTADSTNQNYTIVNSDVNGEAVPATIYYSLATYIKATDNELAKSLYAFGKAVITVRENIYK